ncbi:hypothetical protein SFRURICE_017248 [Spodoptera frugiperda]|nr:hypothetical protein SFRURICE_017248 [Spodoptera frugiperda]
MRAMDGFPRPSSKPPCITRGDIRTDRIEHISTLFNSLFKYNIVMHFVPEGQVTGAQYGT